MKKVLSRLSAACRSLERWEWGVLGALVLSRLLILAYAYPHQAKLFNGDSALYEGLARYLLKTGQYVYPPMEPRSDLIRPPGYPVFIALNYAVFGMGRLLFPLLWNVVGVCLTYLGIRKLLVLLGQRPHPAVGVVFTLDLAWLLYSKEMVTEPIFTPLLLGAVIALIYGMRRGALRWHTASALALGVCALIKPIALYLPVLLVPYVLIVTRRWQPALAFACVFLIVVGPWFARNAAKHDVASFTSVQNDNLLFAHGAFVYADARSLTHVQAKDTLYARLQRAVGGDPKQQSYRRVNRAKGRLARSVLTGHPLLYAKAIARGMAITLLDPGRLVFNRTFPTEDTERIGLTNIVARDGVWGAFLQLLRKDPRMVVALTTYLGFLAVVLGVSLLGVWRAWRLVDPRLFWLMVLVGGYLLVLGGPNGYARFRLYVFPFELLLLHFGVVRVIPRR